MWLIENNVILTKDNMIKRDYPLAISVITKSVCSTCSFPVVMLK